MTKTVFLMNGVIYIYICYTGRFFISHASSNSSDMATKKAKIPTSVEEAKLIIRSYMEHPVNWPVICEEVKANLHVLPEAVQKHYRETSVTKLRRRMNDQIQRYLLMEIEDVSED